MPDDVIFGKAEMVARCVRRAREELAASSDFATDFTRQDAAILNIERACDGTIDIADRIIRLRSMGPAKSSRDSFEKLRDAGVLGADLAERLDHMVGFRNIAVHRYQDLDLAIVRAVIDAALTIFFNSPRLR